SCRGHGTGSAAASTGPRATTWSTRSSSATRTIGCTSSTATGPVGYTSSAARTISCTSSTTTGPVGYTSSPPARTIACTTGRLLARIATKTIRGVSITIWRASAMLRVVLPLSALLVEVRLIVIVLVVIVYVLVVNIDIDVAMPPSAAVTPAPVSPGGADRNSG